MAKENGAPSAAEKGKGKMEDGKALDNSKKKDKDGKPLVNGKKGEEPQEGTDFSLVWMKVC
jgi:26S proteasome regulatory subunit N1